MQQELHVVLFVTLLVMIVICFALNLWLFHRLRKRHPAVFEAIGSPSLFWNNSPRTNWLFLKFLFGSQWYDLGDETLANVCWVMRVWIIAYTALFLALVVAVMS